MTDGLRGTLVRAEMPRWYDDAICAQVDPAIFYPEDGGTTRPAKAICAACPVLEQCRAYAIANDEVYGIWGGTTETERLRIRQRARRQLRVAS